MTTLASSRIERLSGNVSGLTYETSIASSAPGDAGVERRDAERERLVERGADA